MTRSKYSARAWIANNGFRYTLAMGWLAVNAVLFWRTYIYYRDSPQFFYLHEILGVGLCLSRATANVINLNLGVVLLPMCRTLVTALRNLCGQVSPRSIRMLLDHCKGFHILCAFIITLASVFHVCGHLLNANNFSRKYNPYCPDVNGMSQAGEDPILVILTTVPGITGALLGVILSLIVSSALYTVRCSSHDIFWYCHRLYILMYILVLIHAFRGVLKKQCNLPKHTPGCIYLNLNKSSLMVPNNNTDVRMTYNIGKSMTKQKSDKIFKDSQAESSYPTSLFPLDNQTATYMPVDDGLHKHSSGAVNHRTIAGKDQRTTVSSASNLKERHHGYNSMSSSNAPHDKNMRSKRSPVSPPMGGDTGHSLNLLSSTKTQSQDEAKGLISMPKTTRKSMHGWKNRTKSADQPLTGQISPHKDRNQTSVSSETGLHPFPEPETWSFHEGDIVPWPESEPFPEKDLTRWVCAEPPRFQTIGSATWLWVMGPLLLYACDSLYRRWRRGTVPVSVVRVLPHHGILELHVRREGFTCKPGQFILLQYPSASSFEWHPYSVTRCPESRSGEFSIHIKATGDWSGRVTEEVLASCDSTDYATLLPHFNLYMDGPFSSPMEEVLSYRVSVCIAGGIGITPFASTLHRLSNKPKSSLQRLYLVWICRNVVNYMCFTELLYKVYHEYWSKNQPDLFHFQLYLTSTDIDPNEIRFSQEHALLWRRVELGRPDWNTLFSSISESHPRTRVGVFCCGPKSLTDSFISHSHRVNSDRTNFDFHHESF